MSKQKFESKEAGVGHLALFLSLIVIAVIGFAGWRVMSKDKNNDTANNSQSTAESTEAESAGALDDSANTFVAWSWGGTDKWIPLAEGNNPPACKDPLVIKSPMDASKASNVLYPGQVRGGDFKPHGGIGIENASDNKVEVVAPFDAYLFRGGRYVQDGEEQYTFDLVSSCGIMYRVGHLLKLSDKMQAYADQLPAPIAGDSRTTNFQKQDFIKAGTVIATEIGFAQTKNVFFDFGVYDLRAPNSASKDPTFASEPLRLADREQSFFALCWFDLLSGEDKTIVKALPARGIEGKTSDYCK